MKLDFSITFNTCTNLIYLINKYNNMNLLEKFPAKTLNYRSH